MEDTNARRLKEALKHRGTCGSWQAVFLALTYQDLGALGCRSDNPGENGAAPRARDPERLSEGAAFRPTCGTWLQLKDYTGTPALVGFVCLALTVSFSWKGKAKPLFGTAITSPSHYLASCNCMESHWCVGVGRLDALLPSLPLLAYNGNAESLPAYVFSICPRNSFFYVVISGKTSEALMSGPVCGVLFSLCSFPAWLIL